MLAIQGEYIHIFRGLVFLDTNYPCKIDKATAVNWLACVNTLADAC